jgi:hypothetical protein
MEIETIKEEKKKHAGGRPTKYNEEIMLAKVDEYLAQCEDEYSEFHKTRGEKSDSYDRLIKVNLPTIFSFSQFCDVPERTLYDWKDQYPKFSQSLEKIVKLQERRLLEKSLSGEYNPMIAKLVLSSNHGYREKSETDVTSKGERISGFTYVKPDEAGN